MTDMISSATSGFSAAMAQKKDADVQGAQAGLKNKQDVHEAATKFESLYLNEMFSHMFEGLSTDGPFSGGHGEEVFRSMMVEQYGKMVSDSGQMKIAPALEKEMLRMQEQQQNPRGTH